jgi:hypothetical protein
MRPFLFALLVAPAPSKKLCLISRSLTGLHEWARERSTAPSKIFLFEPSDAQSTCKICHSWRKAQYFQLVEKMLP